MEKCCSEVGQRNVVADGDTGSRKDVLVGDLLLESICRLIKIGENDPVVIKKKKKPRMHRKQREYFFSEAPSEGARSVGFRPKRRHTSSTVSVGSAGKVGGLVEGMIMEEFLLDCSCFLMSIQKAS